MMDLVDLNGYPVHPKAYGGNAGRKICISDLDGALWMVKFPEPTVGMRGNVASYTTSPVSEWLGSHVFEAAGIDVHDTVLGFREGRVVCACRDFTHPDGMLLTFHDLKNTISDDLASEYVTRPSDGRSAFLGDVTRAAAQIADTYAVAGLVDRFWEMFVVDALIGNADRNNENWGLLLWPDGRVGLAPVYDNGNSFFNKRRDSTTEARLADERAMREDAVGAARSCYLHDDGHPIAPLRYIESGLDESCGRAVRRVADALDLQRALDLIDELPGKQLGYVVMPDSAKAFHKEILRRRWEDFIVPAARAARKVVPTGGNGQRGRER